VGHGNRIRAFMPSALRRGTNAAEHLPFRAVESERPGGAVRVPGMRCATAASRGPAVRGTIVGGRVDEVATGQDAVDPASSRYGGGVPRALERDSASPAPDRRGRGFFVHTRLEESMKGKVEDRESLEQVTLRFP